MICRNHNLGIAAIAYVRRVVEDKTNELIDVIAAQAGSIGVNPEDVAVLTAIKEQRISFDEKLKLASEAIPASLKPDGANPLYALYSLLSSGMHARTEEECIAIFDEIQDVFEYVFARLRAEIEDRNKVAAKIKKLVGNRQ